MKVLVCVKVVPGHLVEQNSSNKDSLVINPYDLYALQKITEKKTQFGWDITCLCMGPLGAQDILRRCFAMGADQVILLSDPHFSGSDTFATSYIISQAIRKLDYDVIVCGHEAIDGETGQVSCGIASNLNRIYISNVLDFTENDVKNLIVQYQSAHDIKRVKVTAPFVLSFLEYSCKTYISLMALKRARDKEIILWDMEKIGLLEQDCGQNGSKTRVLRSVKAEFGLNKKTEFIEGEIIEKSSFILNQLDDCLG